MKSKIGLKRGIVSLSSHNKNWSSIFESEKNKILKVLGNKVIDIQHIGSTSISRILAKPVIDMAVGMKSLKNGKQIIKKMGDAGYFYRPKYGRTDQHILFAKGNEDKRTHYIHIMKYNGVIWKRDLKFRDYLRNNPKKAKEYENLKKKLAKKYPNNRPLYTEAKTNFILKIINKK